LKVEEKNGEKKLTFTLRKENVESNPESSNADQDDQQKGKIDEQSEDVIDQSIKNYFFVLIRNKDEHGEKFAIGIRQKSSCDDDEDTNEGECVGGKCGDEKDKPAFEEQKNNLHHSKELPQPSSKPEEDDGDANGDTVDAAAVDDDAVDDAAVDDGFPREDGLLYHPQDLKIPGDDVPAYTNLDYDPEYGIYDISENEEKELNLSAYKLFYLTAEHTDKLVDDFFTELDICPSELRVRFFPVEQEISEFDRFEEARKHANAAEKKTKKHKRSSKKQRFL
jgi:hypothetical protein